MTDLRPIIEALLFCSGDAPLQIEQVAEIVPEATPEEISAHLEELRQRYDDEQRGFALFRVAGGYQLMTRPGVGEWVEKFLVGRRRQRLSRAALETLAIVAYRQPATRGEIEAVRGVDCGGVLHTLLDRRLVAVRGRARRVGNPLLYATTDRFLEHFGIEDLRELPKLEEFRALCDRDEAQAELRRQGVLPLPASDESGSDRSADGGAGGDGAETGGEDAASDGDEASRDTAPAADRPDQDEASVVSEVALGAATVLGHDSA